MNLTTSVFTLITIALTGVSFSFAQDIKYDKRDYEVSKHSCVDGICGTSVPNEWFYVKYEDSNTLVTKLSKPIPISSDSEIREYLSLGYDIKCPFAVSSDSSCQATNPTSIYQLHFPQEWPTPLDDYFEHVVPFPQIYYSVSWDEIPIKSDVKIRRKLRIKELNAAIAKYKQLETNPKFIKMKLLLQSYGANFAPLHPTFWKPEYKRGF